MAYASEIVTSAIEACGRPDQEVWAYASLNAVLREIARSADYSEDLYEATYPLADPLEFVTTGKVIYPARSLFGIDESMDLSEWSIRKLAYVMYDSTMLTQVRPQQLFREGCQERDIYYLSGSDYLTFNASVPLSTLKMGAYFLPPVIDKNSSPFSYWVFNNGYDMVIYGIMAKIYKNVGDDGSADRFYQEYQRLMRQFKLDKVGEGVI